MPTPKKLVDLPELATLANTDKFFVNDASDDTDSEEGSSKAITWENIVLAVLASISWGDIGGTLSDQTDLQAALDALDGDISTLASDTTTALAAKLGIAPRVATTASAASITPDITTTDLYTVTAQAAGLTINAPTGTPANGQKLMLRIKDNGTARALTFNAAFRFSSDLAAPTTTVISKTMYLGFIYNSADSKWDCVAVLDNF